MIQTDENIIQTDENIIETDEEKRYRKYLEIEEKILNCQHDDVEDGTCMFCGTSMEYTTMDEYSTCHSSIPTTTAEFEKDLAKLPDIPECIKRGVINAVTMAPKHICRMSRRDQKLYSYIILEYIYQDIPFDPSKIARMMNLSRTSIGEASKLLACISGNKLPQSDTNIKRRAPMIVINPITCIDDNLKLLGMIEHSERITAIAVDILAADKFLYEESPRLVAITLIKYYCDINNIVIKKFHSYFDKITSISIKKCLILVTEAANKAANKAIDNTINEPADKTFID